MKPILTIGIPTCNRSHFLSHSLQSALSQSSDQVRVVVLDNASTDQTKEVVAEYIKIHQDKCVYSANSHNIGPLNNFIRLAERCDTEFFSWLQDDDCLHVDFAGRALDAFRASPDVRVYSAFALLSRGMHSHYKPHVYGPPFPVDFLSEQKCKLFDGRLLAPFSLFMSVTFPPVSVFRTEVLQSYLRSQRAITPLFAERSYALHCAAGGKIAVDPFIGAILRLHSGQEQNKMLHREWEEWRLFAADVERLVETWEPAWLALFEQMLEETDPSYRQTWIEMSQKWPDDFSFCNEVRRALKQSLSLPGRSHQFPQWKKAVRDITPPVLWRTFGTLFRKLLPKR
jgi:hypothetical protein